VRRLPRKEADMSKKKWLILIALGIAVCVTMAAGAFIA
jgi:flagellar basal body-associated protein FliL